METDRLDAVIEELEDELGPVLKAAWVYGSAARDELKEGSDIDLLVLLDDTHEDFDKETQHRAKQLCSDISGTTEDGLELHVQPPKLLSDWWELLISGEPWAVTSLRDAQPIHDPSGYIRATQHLLRSGSLHGTEERALRLMKRSRDKIKDANTLLLEDVTSELLSAMVESAQAVLMYYGQSPPTPENIADRLQEIFVNDEELLTQRAVDDFLDFYELTERIDHGTVTELSGRDLERHLEQATGFVRAMMDLFDQLESRKQRNVVESSYDEAIDLCRRALRLHDVDPPDDDDAVIERFREYFVEEGLIREDQLDLLEHILENRALLQDEGVEDMSEEDIYSSRVYLRDLKALLSDVESQEAFETAEEDRADASVNEFGQQLVEDAPDELQAVWQVQLEDDAGHESIILLFDDTEGMDRQGFADAIRDSLDEARRRDITVTIYPLTDYWNLLRHGSPITFSEIRNGVVIHDPAGFFSPLRKLLRSGKIPGTKEAMRSLIATSPKRVMRVQQSYKSQIVEKLYNAVVDAGQAVLIINGRSPPVQKKLAEDLRQYIDREDLSERDVGRCERVIDYWKDHEHGDINDITGEDIDELLTDTTKFLEAVEELIEETVSDPALS